MAHFSLSLASSLDFDQTTQGQDLPTLLSILGSPSLFGGPLNEGVLGSESRGASTTLQPLTPLLV
jgi:hypothetical protein